MPRYDRIHLGSWGRRLLDEDIARLAQADYGGDLGAAEEAHYAMTGGQARLQEYVGGLMTGDPSARVAHDRLEEETSGSLAWAAVIKDLRTPDLSGVAQVFAKKTLDPAHLPDTSHLVTVFRDGQIVGPPNPIPTTMPKDPLPPELTGPIRCDIKCPKCRGVGVVLTRGNDIEPCPLYMQRMAARLRGMTD